MKKMSRCIRKLENEDYWVVYCNTANYLYPYIFLSIKAAQIYIKLVEKYKIVYISEINDSFVDEEILNKYIKEYINQ